VAIDFQQVRDQANKLAETAPGRAAQLSELRRTARELLVDADQVRAGLQEKVARAARLNPNLICAVPAAEPIHASYPLPPPPERATIIAADGSQIYLDRHSAVEYALVNVGAIWMERGSSEPPRWEIQSKLLYDEQLYTENGRITERLVALMRDLEERNLLARLAANLEPPVITITDGPLEVWGAREGSGIEREIGRVFEEYLASLKRLHTLGVSTAGYVDKPGSDLIIRLLEIHALDEKDLRMAGRDFRPLQGIIDAGLLGEILGPYERSAIFRIQSVTAAKYTEELALHFFYLNLGQSPSGKPFIARVEIPAWVAEDGGMVSNLHALLVEQSKSLGARPYPYLLHRSHETALVTRDEKEQIDAMIAMELHRMVAPPGDPSNKSAAKAVSGRRRYG
jgi:hypothetical protein